MKIGEFLANPLIAGMLFTIFILPAFWGLMKILEYIRFHGSEKEVT